MLCATGQVLAGLRPALLQHREHFAAQIVTGKGGVAVGGVFDPGQALGLGVRLQLLLRNGQQRPGQAALPQRTLYRHRGQATQPGAAQQAEEQGFGLVFAVLASEEYFTGAEHLLECRVTGIAGSLFEAGAGRDLDVDHTQFDA
ncbi:hypothetical protein D3C81_1601220 [compost metagenome]